MAYAINCACSKVLNHGLNHGLFLKNTPTTPSKSLDGTYHSKIDRFLIFSQFFQDDMDKNQKSCIDFAIQAKPLELYVPEEQSGIRYHIWRLVTSGPFENFIMLLIVCNTILLMLKVSLQF